MGLPSFIQCTRATAAQRLTRSAIENAVPRPGLSFSAMFAIVGLQGYLQELLLQHTFQNQYSLFVTALQCGGLALMAGVQLTMASPDDRCVVSVRFPRAALTLRRGAG